MCLVLGALDVAVFFMVEVSQREKWNSGPLVMSYAMDKEKQGCQLTRIFASNGIHHPYCMCDCIEPERVRHLFFSEVGASHMDHHFLMRFAKSLGQLAIYRSSNNFGLAIDEILSDCQTKELEITVQVEAARQQPSCSLEKAKHRDDVLGRERLQAKSPTVTGGAVDKDERIAITADSNTVSERNVHVYGIKVIVFCTIKEATLFGL